MFVAPRMQIRLPRDQYLGTKIYFVTICCEDRRSIFLDANRAERAIEALKRISDAMGFLVHAYCLMPDHVHVLAEAQSATSNLIKFVAQWKQSTGYLFRDEPPRRFWQRRFYDHILRRPEDSDSVAWYIWRNPVRKGIVAEASQYPFSGSFTVEWPKNPQANERWVPPWKERDLHRDALKLAPTLRKPRRGAL
jgi:putative transposase